MVNWHPLGTIWHPFEGAGIPGSSKWPFFWGVVKWPFQGLSDRHLGDHKVTWKQLVYRLGSGDKNPTPIAPFVKKKSCRVCDEFRLGLISHWSVRLQVIYILAISWGQKLINSSCFCPWIFVNMLKNVVGLFVADFFWGGMRHWFVAHLEDIQQVSPRFSPRKSSGEIHSTQAALPEGRRGHVAAFGGASGAEYRGTPTKLAGRYTSPGMKPFFEGNLPVLAGFTGSTTTILQQNKELGG